MLDNGKKIRKYVDPERQARYIFPEERERIYKCQVGDLHEKRNITICRLGFTTGLRVGEIAALKLSNFLNENWALLPHCGINNEQSKGGYGGRRFFLAKSTRKSIIEYIEERQQEAKMSGKIIKLSDPLFVSQKGSKYHDKHFSVKGLTRLIKIMFLKAGVKNNSSGKASSHSMRRTFATDISRKYPQPKVIQILLGHNSPYMSQIYVTTNSEQLNNIIKDVFK